MGFEVLTTLLIRDGLVLNVLMLVWPLEAVRGVAGGRVMTTALITHPDCLGT